MHEIFLEQALILAKEAYDAGEVPVGCVIVSAEGEIIGRGRNRREERTCALAHAELIAIEEACKTFGDWRLRGATLYVTLEPCPMCAGAIINARIPKIYYAAKDPTMGACGSVTNLFFERFGHNPQVTGGIYEAQASALMSAFFQKLR